MTKRKNKNTKQQLRQTRRFVVHGIRRDPPDVRKLSRALIRLAQAELERDAQAEHEAQHATDTPATEKHHEEQPSDEEGGTGDGTRHG